MLNSLRSLLPPEQIRLIRNFLLLLTVSGLFEAGTTLLLIPVTQSLMTHAYDRLESWVCVLTIAVMITCLLRYWQTVRGMRLSVVILRTVQSRLGQHMVRLPLGWFSGEVSGQVSRCATYGAMGLANALSHLLPALLADIAVPLLTSGAMLLLDWRLGIVALGGAIGVLVANSRISKSIIRGEAPSYEATVTLNNRVIEFARCQATLRAFCHETAAYSPLTRALEAKNAAGQSLLATTFPKVLISGLSVQLVFMVLVGVGLFLTLSGWLVVPRLMAFLVLAARFSGGLAMLGARMGVLGMISREIGRIAAIMNEPTLPEAPRRKNLTAPGAITFRSVEFGFHHGDVVLHDVTFEVTPGSVIGLIGPSGAGKSTLLKLMMRFYDPMKGQILIGGVDLRDLPTDQLMDQIALVSQDVVLFAGSIEDNIRIGNPDASEETWRHAAHLARVDELVARRRHGWSTQVGEGGCQLSGGERQRVALARALLKNAPILLLDEASSSLDALNVAAFQDVVKQLRGKTTIVMITHQLETVMHADHLLTIETGRIVESGTPADCLISRGYFDRFCRERRQASGWRLTG